MNDATQEARNENVARIGFAVIGYAAALSVAVGCVRIFT